MSYINASVTDQVLKITSAPPLSSGGVNETHVEFTFCEKWEGFEKTALFYREEGEYYYSILDENNVCIVPWEVYSTAGTFYFSVFGNKDDVRRTTNTVKYKVTKGLPEEGAIPSDPTPEVYEQLVAMVEKAVDVAEDMENKRDSGYFDGASIHYCAFTGKLNQNGAIGHIDGANTNAFAKGLPKANDLFVTTSGYAGRVTQVIASTTITGKPAHTIAYALVADLRAQPPVRGVDYWTEADKAEIEKETVDKCCPTFTESGSVVACEPVEGYPLGVVSKIVPKQSGTGDPTPDNVRPISGHTAVNLKRCGKNLINPSEYMAATNDEEERTTLDGDVFTTRFTSGGIHVNMRYGPCKTHPKGTYTFSFIPLTDGANVFAFVYAKSSGDTIARKELLGSNLSLTFTANEEFYISLGGINGSLGTYSYKLQLEEGTTATEYEPYREAETVTFDLGQTVYGGSLDWTTGLLTVTHKGVDMSALNWKTDSLTFYADLDNGKRGEYCGVHCFCSAYSVVSPETTTDWHEVDNIVKGITNKIICGSHLNAGCKTVVGNPKGQTLEEFKAELAASGAFLVYLLKEPITVQLTPQEILALSGVNTIYADTGDITITGKADPTAIIQDLCNKVNALSATMTALTGV